jgi:hypothetical protein
VVAVMISGSSKFLRSKYCLSSVRAWR